MTGSSRQLVAAALALLPTLIAGRAIAQEPTPPPPPAMGGTAGVFGERGEMVISHDLPFSASSFGGSLPQVNIVHESQSMGGGSTTLVQIQPALDYFISPGVSVGGVVGIGHGSDNSTGGGSVTEIIVGARAGYNVPLAPNASVWIRGGLAYRRLSFSGGGGGADASSYTVPLTVVAAFLWHPVPHLFLGIGPAFATDIISKFSAGPLSGDGAKTTDIGLTSVVGGYFGGP